MKKQIKKQITIDKTYVLNSSYADYKYLTEYMVGGQEGNYRHPGIADVTHPSGTPGSDYPFYAYFSSLVDNTTILELGTSVGGSAVMLSHNQTNKIISYDITNFGTGGIKRENVEFRIGNFMEDSSLNYDEIDLMTLDVSHDGNTEKGMIKYLENTWKGGLLFLDDIHNNANGNMSEFWNGIDTDRHEVFDISDIGHAYHGNGLINFNKFYDLNIVEYDRKKLSISTIPPIH